ncbi:MAG TPA: hypothetical protein VHB48_10160 [Chitinophagaceae bacterium]|jgi:hypothetical protein|nr:hypothetical protein [Chitinophagaceae bacterium]
MYKYSLIFLFFLFIYFSAGAQLKSLNEFIPQGFTILDTASGDLNRDSITDMVLILQNRYENFNTDTTRPLLLLQGCGNELYKLLARNDSVVLCFGCGGIYGDPYNGIVIKHGYFSIQHLGGSGWRWTRIITFRYIPKTKQFILHRDAGEYWHVSDPSKTTGIINNKEDFDKLPFNKFSYAKNW